MVGIERNAAARSGVSHGFDNVAMAQEISYVQLARYLEAAEAAIHGAMRLRPAPKPTKVRTWFNEEGRVSWQRLEGPLRKRRQPSGMDMVLATTQQCSGTAPHSQYVARRPRLVSVPRPLPRDIVGSRQTAAAGERTGRVDQDRSRPYSCEIRRAGKGEDGGIVEFTAWQREGDLLEFHYATADDRMVSHRTKDKKDPEVARSFARRLHEDLSRARDRSGLV